MIKTVLKTLSLSLVALGLAATSSAREQNRALLLMSMPPAESMVGCSPQAEIDRGWEFQQELLEARLAAKGPEAVNVPGAIIEPPFPSFAPYRTDLPSSIEALENARPSASTSRPSRTRRANTNKS
jgi:hypothetical protein